MDLPWFPHFPGDCAVQTAHLDTEQCGAFGKIRDHMWSTADCAIPSDMDTLRNITGLPKRRFSEKIGPVLSLLTRLDNGKYTIPQLRETRMRALVKRAQCVAAGRRGGRKRSQNEKFLDSNSDRFERQIPNKNNEGGQADAMPSAMANADIYQNPEIYKWLALRRS